MFGIYDLKCNEMAFPQGISDPAPVFSYKLSSTEPDTFQTSRRIRVWMDEECVWDSGQVKSGEIFEISYEGHPLKTGYLYRWSVECRDNHGNSAVSEEACFLTGIMEADFWSAAWIEATDERKECRDSTRADLVFSGHLKSKERPEEDLNPPVYFRKAILIEKEVRRAVVFASAHGIYDLQFDGVSVSNLFAPEFTSYAKHLEYQTYDVTEFLNKGIHGIGCILADGWYTGKIGLLGVGNQFGTTNAFLMQLEIEYADGSHETIGTDQSFKWNYGAYEYADLFVGEYINTGKNPEGFSYPYFDDSGWSEVAVKPYGYENLKGQSIEPVCILREIKPSLIITPKGEVVLDAGENIAGYTTFTLEGKAGQEIGLEHSEVLDADGNFLQNIMGQNKNQKDRILCAEDGEISYCPKFTFHGFRYVKVTGLDDINPVDFTICVLGSGLQETGFFQTTDPLLNQLQENIVRSQEANMMIIPTDCPQRERAGWTGDMQVFAPTAVFNLDVNAFLQRWLYDMRIEQLPDGQIPHVIPQIDSNKYIDNSDGSHISSAGWADACVIVPYSLYRAYGSKKILRDNFDMMCRWMDYVASTADESGIWGTNEFHFGDWLLPSVMAATYNPMETAVQTKEEVASAMHVYTTEMMTEICAVLGETKMAAEFEEQTRKIRNAFAERFIDPDGMMRKPFQGLYVLALRFILPADVNTPELIRKREGCIKNLVSLIHKNHDTLDTGFLSVPFLLDTLCRCGEKELAYRLLRQTTPPSWLYAVTMGATTIWENWMAVLPDGTRTNSSYNHFAFGCVGDFMYRKIGGLQIEEAGMKKVRIAPDFDCGLSGADTVYESRYGKIRIHWKREKAGVYLEVELPPNSTGVVVFGGEEIEKGNGKFFFTEGVRSV